MILFCLTFFLLESIFVIVFVVVVTAAVVPATSTFSDVVVVGVVIVSFFMERQLGSRSFSKVSGVKFLPEKKESLKEPFWEESGKDNFLKISFHFQTEELVCCKLMLFKNFIKKKVARSAAPLFSTAKCFRWSRGRILPERFWVPFLLQTILFLCPTNVS